MIPLLEHNDSVVSKAVSSPAGKDYYIQGIFMQANKPNRNGRIYPLPILVNEVANYVRTYVNQKMALGELNHPESPSLGLDKVSHLITELKQDGDNFIGKAKILGTPTGNIVKVFIDEGVKLGVSSRGMGSLKEDGNGIQVVQDDYSLATVDIVASPSAQDAFVQGLREHKEWIWNNGKLIEKICSKIEQKIKSPKKFDEKAMLESFNTFLNALSKNQ